ncbi:MAG: hypothetical protein ACOCV2_08125, partial [Persicimonas sp.]
MKHLLRNSIALSSCILLACALSLGACTSSPDYPGGDAESNPDGGSNAGACDDECEGDTPVCDESAGECVECLDAEEDCEDDQLCSSDGECVECLEEKDCDEGVCSDDGTCVECVEDDHCTEADASACTEDNECTGCEESDQCAHLADDGTPACDADTSECVECTVDDESACDGNSCDPASNTCTDTETDSLDTCESCIADSECSGDAHCVPLEFDGSELDDGYCLQVKPDDGCEGPYGTEIERESLSGEEETYCGINEDLTTCEAVLDHL